MRSQFKKVIFALVLFVVANNAIAQTTAMNFNRKDCNGNNQNLFADLDAGKAVILEFFMTNCAPCVNAGNVLEIMKAKLLLNYPGKVKSYSIGFNNTYSCTQVSNWVTTNGFSSVPMDSGATQVAYYGGFGMPTIVILGDGTAHNILGSPYLSFVKSDTTFIGAYIRNSLNTLAGIKEKTLVVSDLDIYPNPSHEELNVKVYVNESTDLKMQIFSFTGQLVLDVPSEKIAAGLFTKNIKINGIASGNYLLKIASNDRVVNKKIIISE